MRIRPHEVLRNCEHCGKEFVAKRVNVANNRDKCCSRKCGTEVQKIRVKVNCQICGKEMEVKPCELRRGRGKTCSRKCGSQLMALTRWGPQEPEPEIERPAALAGWGY